MTVSSLVVVSAESVWGSLKQEAEVIDRIIEKTECRIHLRKHELDLQQMVSLLELVSKDSMPFISLHSFHSLQEDFGIGGLHYTENNFNSQAPSKTEEVAPLLSTSFHTVEQCESAATQVDYSFLCPVFDSISSEKLSPFDWSELSRKKLPEKVYALGGICKQNIRKVKESYFSGVALKGALWGEDDPVAYAKECASLWTH